MHDDDTRLTHAGLHPRDHHGIVNPPVYHASTVLYPTLEAFDGHAPVRYHYGRHGTPTTAALEEAMVALEGGAGAVLTPSGLAAIATAILACVKVGDHILVTDSVYGPTRQFCDEVLRRFGVHTQYYDPRVGEGIAGLIRPETAVVFLESPGSLSFEVQDTAAIARAARAAGVRTIADNTWAAGYFFKPLAHGVDIVVQALTKFVGGHSDVMLGAVVCAGGSLAAVRAQARLQGNSVGPDDCFLALRGLRSLGARLRQHQSSGLALARWLAGRPEVARVIHPVLEDHPDHALWRRDFTGACGLFALVLHPVPRPALAAFLEGLALFGMGYSWGGYESLLIPTDPARLRTATDWEAQGQTLRIHVGLESLADLIADLEAGFERLGAAGG